MRFLPENTQEFKEPDMPMLATGYKRAIKELDKKFVNIKDFDSVYQIDVFNFVAFPVDVVLFGANQFLLAPNFGNPVGLITITNTGGASYLEILKESQETPFLITAIRFETVAPIISNQIVRLNYRDGNGFQCTIPFKPSSYFSIDQFQPNFIEANDLAWKIDSHFNLRFLAQPALTTITLFIKEKIKPQNKIHNLPITEIHKGQIQIPQRKIYLFSK